jgi:small subunit ribosomal protein S26e
VVDSVKILFAIIFLYSETSFVNILSSSYNIRGLIFGILPDFGGTWIIRFKAYGRMLTQYMPKKRASRGRSKGGKGSSGAVHCSQCGALVPRDKAKKVTGRITLVEPTLAKELRAAGAYIPMSTDVKFYCVSCAVHRGVVKVRSESDRRTAGKLR